MSDRVSRLTMSVRGFPTLSAAAKMIGVAPGTLSRRNPPFEIAGPKEHRLRPRVVLEEAGLYGRRPLRSVAEDLIAYGRAHAPESAGTVEAEVRDAMALYEHPDRLGHERLLAAAEQSLPADLFAQVVALVRQAEALPAVADLSASPEYLAELDARDHAVAGAGERRRPPRTRRAPVRAAVG